MSDYMAVTNESDANTLAHSKSYKYVRKYKGKNGRWVYVYKRKTKKYGNETKKVTDGDQWFTREESMTFDSTGPSSRHITVKRGKVDRAIDNAQKSIKKKKSQAQDFIDSVLHKEKYKKNLEKKFKQETKKINAEDKKNRQKQNQKIMNKVKKKKKLH